MVKIWFETCTNLHFVYTIMRSVHADHGTEHMLDWESALQYGLVLNHSLSYMKDSCMFIFILMQCSC